MPKPDFLFNQSAVIPYRLPQGRLEILLITSNDGKRWGVPKGVIEPDLTPAASAAKEALEEAGIKGTVEGGSLGTFTYDKWGGTCRVQVFLLRVVEILDQWDEMFRQREWVSVEEAVARIRFPELKAMVARVPQVVQPEPPDK
jgi:8-oxo-dGTP pyrophosphatase MutT (NUDIX family)